MARYQGTDIYCDRIIPQHTDGENKVRVLQETGEVPAFYHTRPYWPVHIVVVPKQHIGSLLDLPEDPELAAALLAVVRELSEKVVRDAGACRLLTNLGGYQDSKHLHFHISSGAPLEKRSTFPV